MRWPPTMPGGKLISARENADLLAHRPNRSLNSCKFLVWCMGDERLINVDVEDDRQIRNTRRKWKRKLAWRFFFFFEVICRANEMDLGLTDCLRGVWLASTQNGKIVIVALEWEERGVFAQIEPRYNWITVVSKALCVRCCVFVRPRGGSSWLAV